MEAQDYDAFLDAKRAIVPPAGFEPGAINGKLYPFQRDIVAWACRKGKACIFADCGMGKTAMQLEWADQVCRHVGGGMVLIVAPLAVSAQTVREGRKFGIEVNQCREACEMVSGINITNYEKLHKFDGVDVDGVVLDESSILKSYSGKVRNQIIDMFKATPFKLACTATPAPNDYMELGNHAEFVSAMSRTEMLATFFMHDGGNTSKWRLKGHAEVKFFEWVASWACCITNPSDLGYDGSAFVLPDLNIVEIVTKSDNIEDDSGQMLLFAETVQTLNERRAARRNSMEDRVRAAADIANSTNEQVLVWCDLNAESEALTDAINGAVEVRGSQTPEYKEQAMNGFTDGTNRVLVSKPSIAGWGMNWQQCNTMIFVGLSDSFEAYYQAVRRCWRFGQKRPVTVYIIISEAEGCVKQNIERKQADAQRMTRELVKFTKDILSAEIRHTSRMTENYITVERMEMPAWIA